MFARARNLCLTFAVATLAAACEGKTEITTSSCVGCHRPEGAGAGGLEVVHTTFALACVDCHGGDPTQTDKGASHVPNPAQVKSLHELGTREIEEVDPAYLKFVNPTNPFTVQTSCGAESPQAGAFAGCHQQIVDTMRISMHFTNAGLVHVPRFDQGLTPARPVSSAIIDANNRLFVPSQAPRYTYASQAGIAAPNLSMAGPNNPGPYLDMTLTKACSGCHLSVFGGSLPSNAENHRGSGCAACHVKYAADGLSKSGDPGLDKAFPSRPEKHQISRYATDDQCERCHQTSFRIGLSFKGWRERSSIDTSEALVTNTTPVNGKPAGYYVLDENGATPADETAADVHAQAGLRCVDCHVAADVHGDGHLRPNAGSAVGIECVDCHGGYASAAAPGPDGQFRASGGHVLERLRIAEDGRHILRTVDGVDRPVPQLVNLGDGVELSSAHNDDHGELECYACHTAWMPNYYFVQRTLDLRESEKNSLTGQVTPGKVSVENRIVTTGDLFLGMNTDGKIGTFQIENAFLTVVDSCNPANETCTENTSSPNPGKIVVRQYVGRSSEGRRGFGFRPVFAHTTAGKATTQRCERCHVLAGDANLADVRGVYGFGNGKFDWTDPVSGGTYDLSRMIDETGTATVSLGHLLARPIPFERIQRILNLAK